MALVDVRISDVYETYMKPTGAYIAQIPAFSLLLTLDVVALDS